MKYLLCFIFAIFNFWGISQSMNNDRSNLLWEITGKKLKKPSYLFGTIHLNDPQIFKFSDSTYYAFTQTEIFCPEIDVYDLFDSYSKVLNKNLLVSNNEKIYPHQRRSLPDRYESALGWPQFLDAYFNQIAANSDKKVIPLESITEQLNAINAVAYYTPNYTRLSNKELIKTYLAGDIAKINQTTAQAFEGSNGYKEIIVNRNLKMSDKIDSIIQINSAFIAVGAAHLAGITGIIHLLEKKGYHLRSVGDIISSKMENEKQFFKAQHSYLYVDSVLKFKMKFGLKPKLTVEDSLITLESRDLGQGNVYILEIQKVEPTDKVQYFLDENFFQPQNANLHLFKFRDKWEAYQGIIEISEFGLCYKRIFIKDGYLFKLTCSGDLPFLLSDRSNTFFDSIQFF